LRRALLIAAALLLGVLGGVGSALAFSGLLTDRIRLGDFVEIDGWESSWTVGTDTMNPYTKAWVARFGLFALRREEAVYFITRMDSEGRALDGRCTYALTVENQPGSWWSVTVYNADGYLPQNTHDRLSFDALQAERDQRRQVLLSADKPDAAAGNGYWVSTDQAGAFDVTLRIYQPTPAAILDPANHFDLPEIVRRSCGAGGSS